MSVSIDINKDVTTFDTTAAITLVVPDDLNKKINEIRSIYDKAYLRWMSHINLIFPFISLNDDKLKEVENMLDKKLKNLKPFTLSLSEMSFFSQGKTDITIHIKPNEKSAEYHKLQELYKNIRSALPDVTVKRELFCPHLTIGQIKKNDKKTYEEIQNWFEENKNNLTFEVNNICILSRSKDDNSIPFSILKRITFN